MGTLYASRPKLPDTLEDNDARFFREWTARRLEVESIAGELLTSKSFARLASITFLGALSPRFRTLLKHPLFPSPDGPPYPDGSRSSHSLGVALITLDLLKTLGFSAITQCYGVAWALLHDIGNWPLSHTGEYAFSRLTALSTRDVRRHIILGSPVIPGELALSDALSRLCLDPHTLLAITEHRLDDLNGELRALALIVDSPLTPDMLEGMWRCGRVFHIPVPSPRSVVRSLLADLFADLHVQSTSAREILNFWRAKALIYNRFINRARSIRFESAWSRAILRQFHNVSLGDSLFLVEDDIVQTILNVGLDSSLEVSRYKDPIEYFVRPRRRRTLPSATRLQDLGEILTSRRSALEH